MHHDASTVRGDLIDAAPIGWLATVGCLAFLGLGTFGARRIVRVASQDAPQWWVWGQGFWGACLRALPSLIASGWGLTGAFIPASAVKPGSVTELIFIELGFWWFIGWFVAAVFVALFNWPRFIVPR